MATEARFQITADTKEFDRAIKRAHLSFGNLAKVGASAALKLAQAVGAAATAVGALALKGVQLGDQLSDTAQKLGTTAGALESLRFAAQQTGVEQNALDQGLQRMTRRLAEAAKGSGEAKAALKQLGINAQEVVKLPLEQQFLKIADAMESVQNPSERIRLGFKLFDSEGVALINTLGEGRTALQGFFDEAKELGLVLGTTQQRVIGEAADSIDRMKSAFKGLSLQLGAAFGPAIEAAAKAITSMTIAVERALPKLTSLAERFLGIKKAAYDLSDAELRQGLEDRAKEILAIGHEIDKVQKAANAARGVQKEGLLNTLDALKREREELIKRYQDLSTEAAKRTAPPPAEKDEQSQAGDELEEITVNHFERMRDLGEALRAGERAARKKQVDELREFLKTEQDVELERYENEQKMLEDALELKLVTEEEYRERLEKAEQEHQDRLTAMADEANRQRTESSKSAALGYASAVVQGLTDATAAVAGNSKRMFEWNKKLAIASAALSGREAVLAVLSDKTLPTIARFALAGVAAAKAAAQISAIRSTHFGGGTTPSAAGGSTVNGNPVQAAAPQQIIQVRGVRPDQIFSGRQIVDLINAAQKDGAKIVFAN